MKKNFLSIIAIISLSFILWSCEGLDPEEDNWGEPSINSIHVALGVPEDDDLSDDYYIVRSQYVVSYNKDRNVPNWVSWNLNADWFGDVSRYSGKFITDTSLPAGFYRVTHDDYTNSGFDRGHMVRSEERTASAEDNRSTFYLTNILPQAPDMNQGVWLKLEYYCEDLCKTDNKELYIIAGGIFHSDNSINSIVSVPDSCFKIIVVLERGQKLRDVTENTEVISVVIPNIQGVRKDDWETYKTSVRRIENSTGYNFLSCVKRRIQNIIETR